MKQIFSFLIFMVVVVCMYAAPPPHSEMPDQFQVESIIPSDNMLISDINLLTNDVAREVNNIGYEVMESWVNTPSADDPTFLIISVDMLDIDNSLLASLTAFGNDSYPQSEDPGTVEEDTGGIADFVKSNWIVLIIGFMTFLKVVVNLTPTTKDNQVFSWIDSIFNLFIPNYKAGGGTHNKSE